MRLEGKVAIITGGARGQGATEARMFAQEGARVVIGDVRDDQGMQVEAEIRELGGEAVYLHLDVTSADDLAACYRHRRAAFWQGGCAGQQRGHRGAQKH